MFKKIASINLGGSAGINTKASVLYRGFFYGIIWIFPTIICFIGVSGIK
jgi:hypothetical protein